MARLRGRHEPAFDICPTCARDAGAWPAADRQPSGAVCHQPDRCGDAGLVRRGSAGRPGAGRHAVFRAAHHGIGLCLGAGAAGGHRRRFGRGTAGAARDPDGAVDVDGLCPADAAGVRVRRADSACRRAGAWGGRAGASVSGDHRLGDRAGAAGHGSEKLSGRAGADPGRAVGHAGGGRGERAGQLHADLRQLGRARAGQPVPRSRCRSFPRSR